MSGFVVTERVSLSVKYKLKYLILTTFFSIVNYFFLLNVSKRKIYNLGSIQQFLIIL